RRAPGAAHPAAAGQRAARAAYAEPCRRPDRGRRLRAPGAPRMSALHAGLWLATCALCVLAAAGIARGSGFFRAVLDEGAGRFETIDGLRGFLALGVFGEHAMSMRSLHVAGAWAVDLPEFYLRASGAGVGLFF